MTRIVRKTTTVFFGDLNLTRGGDCPTCGRWCKMYRRGINATMGYALVWMVKRFRANGGKWINMPRVAPRFVVESNQFSTMKHWGLVEAKPNTDPKRKTSGRWRPTAKGIAFALGRTTIPAKVDVFDDRAVAFSGDLIDIEAALSTEFDYREVMKAGT